MKKNKLLLLIAGVLLMIPVSINWFNFLTDDNLTDDDEPESFFSSELTFKEISKNKDCPHIPRVATICDKNFHLRMKKFNFAN